METKIIEILEELQPSFNFKDEEADFVKMGYLDSFDVVTLVAELEHEFSILISALDIIPENFASVKSICQLVEKSKTT
jgi:acyl carrier protein